MPDHQICIPFNVSHLVFIFVILGVFFYFLEKTRETFSSINLTSHLTSNELQKVVSSLQTQLFNCQVSSQNCQRELVSCQSSKSAAAAAKQTYNQNSLDAPERNYSSNSSYQMIGFLSSNTDRFPLFGRTKYPRRSDKWEYYTMDETRNRIKIIIKTKGDNELYDGDSISIPELNGQFTVKLYEYSNVCYNPDLM